MPAETTMDASAIPGGTVFSVDVEKREIRGRAVPHGVVGVKNGMKFQFSKGKVHPREGMTVKLWALHEKENASGVVTEWDDTDAGLDVAFKVAKTPEGDRALAQADAGVWDGLSIGPSEGAKYALRDGVYHAVDIPIHEISLTPAPVFGGARVSSVAFDVIQEGNTMTDTLTEQPAPVAVLPDTFSSDISEAISKGFEQFAALDRPEVVHAAGGGLEEIHEPSPYRFDGTPGQHSFSLDMRDAAQGDSAARQRLAEFSETFAVTTTNTGTLNPTKNRPDLYVPNLQFSRPLWESVTTGSVDDVTPFTIPKFNTASGLVGAHTQGVEPTPGSFSATNQTITPTAISGKIEINREVLDQGGSPKADAIIWAEMLNAWYEALEARIATQLAAIATTEINLASATDAALVNALTNYFAGLQFVRGGNRFTAFVADGQLFPKLVSAADSTGRKLLPVLGPSNAQGTVGGGFDRVQLGNQGIRAAWALGSATTSKSYSFVPSSVWAWASAPKRFDFQYQVKSVDMAIWGYGATAVTRDSDVQPIDYTTAD